MRCFRRVRRIGEVRLLGVDPGTAARGCCRIVPACSRSQCLARGLDLLIVSATTRQRRLYEHLGFGPSGRWWGTKVPGSSRVPHVRALSRGAARFYVWRRAGQPLSRALPRPSTVFLDHGLVPVRARRRLARGPLGARRACGSLRAGTPDHGRQPRVPARQSDRARVARAARGASHARRSSSGSRCCRASTWRQRCRRT